MIGPSRIEFQILEAKHRSTEPSAALHPQVSSCGLPRARPLLCAVLHLDNGGANSRAQYDGRIEATSGKGLFPIVVVGAPVSGRPFCHGYLDAGLAKYLFKFGLRRSQLFAYC